MKSLTKLAVAGISGVVLFKLITTVLVPVLAMILGLLALTVKLALIAAVLFFLYTLLKKPDDDERDPDGEIVVEADAEESDDEGGDGQDTPEGA